MNKSDQPPSSFFGGILTKITSLLMGFVPSPRATSREDVLESLRQAEADGIVARDAYDMIQRVLYVSDLKVRDILIPRSNMISVEREDSLDKCLDIMVESAHSRFPVVDNEKDQIIGILLAKDLLRYFDDDNKQRFNLRDLMRPVVFVPESKRLNVLLAEFRENRNHIAVVVDEFGAVAGLVTIEDVLEQIVGDIEDEHDFEDDETLIRELEDGEIIVKAVLPIDEFNQHFHSYLSESGSDTIGGLISQTLGHVPQRGETLNLGDFDFEIVHADSRRIHLIRVIKQQVEQSAI